jgi:hypothetical protein
MPMTESLVELDSIAVAESGEPTAGTESDPDATELVR